MATGAKMSYNHYQSGKYGTLPQSSQDDVQATQDMHLKMSKKIAQLTKVIYALNTKNDENESVLQALRDQHEEEIQQILNETKQKVTLYKERVDEETDQRTQIETLQNRLSSQQTQLASTEEKFTQYKSEVQEKLQKEKDHYATRLFDMSHEMLEAKKDFEEQTKKYNQWKERKEAEHNTALAELESKHQTEMHDLRDLQRNQDDSWLNKNAEKEEAYKAQIADLIANAEKLQDEKSQMHVEFTLKLEKAQAFYEKELDALKKHQIADYNSEVEALKKEIEKLRSDSSSGERELRVQIDRLVHQLADTEDKLVETQKREQMLQGELSGKESSSSELIKQLKDLHEELSGKNSQIQNKETELSASKQHCTVLADEMKKKSITIGELEAHRMQNHSQLKEMEKVCDSLKQELMKLNAERSSLLSQHSSTSVTHQSEVENLRQALETLTIEKETQKQRLEKQIQSLKEEMVLQEKKLKSETTQKLEEAANHQKELQEKDRKVAAEVLTATKQELIQCHAIEMSKSKGEKDDLQKEFDRINAELTSRLQMAEDRICHLDNLLKEREDGLGTASNQVQSLRDSINQLRTELEKTQSELKASKINGSGLQAQLEKLQLIHDGKVAEMEVTLKSKMKTLANELDVKWKETMKLENNKLRQELTSLMEEEKKAALSQLARLKDAEIIAVRAGLEQKVNYLNGKIEELQALLNNASVVSQAERQKWEQEMEREKMLLNENMLEAANDHAAKISSMEKIHADEIEKLVTQKEQEKQTVVEEMQKKHLDDMQAQMVAHNSAISHATQMGNKQKQDELAQLQTNHKEEMENLRNQLNSSKESALEALKQSHAMEIQAARMELERAVEISKQKERSHQMQIEELRTEIGHHEQHIKNLQDQLGKLQSEINKLKKEIEKKVSEIKQVQKQATQDLRMQEDKLGRVKQQALENMAADHQQEQEEILTQFNRAQEMLKDKISTLQIELEEAEDRYNQRDSRPEDLELIESLRCNVDERETRIKDLIEEKRFYQLELVNRETNFNKVFNTTPNVGVLNPFQKPKKKGEKNARLTGAAGANGHQKLEPLPNSPLHSGNLNPSRPLPQPAFAKKFMK